MDLITLYARREPAQERAQFLKLTEVGNWFDTCLYKDRECKALEARFPHDYESTPQEGAKTAMVNCNNYALEWVPAIPSPRVVVFEDWSDGDIYDSTQTSSHLRSGDILVMLNKQDEGGEPQRRIGLLYSAWPVILVGDSDELHSVYSAHGTDRANQVAMAGDWLAKAGEDDPQTKAAAYLLNALMKPDANFEALLQGVEQIQAAEFGDPFTPRPAA